MPNKLSGRAGFVVGDEYKRDGVQVGGGGWLVGGTGAGEVVPSPVRACVLGWWVVASWSGEELGRYEHVVVIRSSVRRSVGKAQR